MESVAFNFAFPNPVLDCYYCEEPRWSFLWWIFANPESECPPFMNIYQVVAFYLFLLCILSFLAYGWKRIRNKGCDKVIQVTEVGDGDVKALLKNMELYPKRKYHSYDYPLARCESRRCRICQF